MTVTSIARPLVSLRKPWLIPLIFFTLFCLFATGLRAEPDFRQDFDRAMQAMAAARQPGPAEIPILDQATLNLPEGFVFVPQPAAAQFMQTLGNPVGEGFIGLIFPPKQEEGWIVTVSYEASGYIRDTDAQNWKVEEMLDSLKRGTEEINQARAARGLNELDVVGWAEAPNYDAFKHRLVWSLAVRSRGAAPDAPDSVNYNTYALGREGYVSLNLVTALNEIEQRKTIARTLLAALDFKDGKRYTDFNESTDHVAEYGLAALVGGLAAKKLGLFAVAAVFLAKFGKLAAVFLIGVLGLFGRRFGKRRSKGGFEA